MPQTQFEVFIGQHSKALNRIHEVELLLSKKKNLLFTKKRKKKFCKPFFPNSAKHNGEIYELMVGININNIGLWVIVLRSLLRYDRFHWSFSSRSLEK